jgi:O-antigen ligase
VSLEPRIPAEGDLEEIREAARAQSSHVSSALVALVGAGFALFTVAVFVILDYRFDQDPHRLVKLLLAGTAFSVITMNPLFGMWLLPVVSPLLPWIPPLPLPGLNAQNLLILSIFGFWAVFRVIRREPLLRMGSLGPAFLMIVGACGLFVLRGAAFPTGYEYDAATSGIFLFRASMTFFVYFMTLAMVKGETARRRIAWALAIALLVEAVITLIYGRSGRGGRAVGSIGQANELGTFLALFAVLTAAMIAGAQRAWQKLILLATTVMATIGTFMSVSRGAIIALAIGLLYVSLRTSRMFTVVMIVGALSAPLWIPDYVMERMTSTQVEVEEGTDETELEGSAQSRMDTWTAIMRIVEDHPIDGVGFDGLGYILPKTGEDLGLSDVHTSAHNTFLRFLAEMGVLGLVVFVLFLWSVWALSVRGVRLAASRFDRQVAVGLGAAIIVLAVSCAFGDRFWAITVTGNLWILCAVVDDAVLERREAAA